MAALRLLGRLSPVFVQEGLGLLLPVYPWIRSQHARRLRACFAASPFANQLTLPSYYRARLRLLLQGLRQHGRSITTESVAVSGIEHYREALGSGRPVALIGLHTGVLELLHRIPEAPDNRPFLILTAPAFAPALTIYMAGGRQRDGKSIIWNGRPPIGTSSDSSLIAGLRKVLKTNGVLALMADQNPLGTSKQDFLTLWDRIEVPYPARLLDFLRERDFQFVPVSTLLNPDGRSSFRFHPAWKASVTSSGRPEVMDQASLRTQLRDFLEAGIAAAPEQWNWSYPKIRVRSA